MRKINYYSNTPEVLPNKTSGVIAKHAPIGIILAVLFFLFALAGFAFYYTRMIESNINSYEDCVKAGYPVLESFPAVCVTKSGRRFTEPITTIPVTPSITPIASAIPSQNDYECPSSGWVDCMPSPDMDKSKTCSPDALNWFKTHCPDFLGAAY